MQHVGRRRKMCT